MSTTLRRFDALRGPQGRELLEQLAEETVTAETSLRIGTTLRTRYPAELVADAVAQHELRMRARAKFTRAMDMFFTRPGLEQASSEVIARHRAQRYPEPAVVADLCCGVGGDLIALAAGRSVLAVDTDPVHLAMAEANSEVYGLRSRVRTDPADVRDVDLAGVRAVFCDPARRTGRGRMPGGDSEPPLRWCLGLTERVEAVAVKAAPGLAHETVPPGWELEFIALGRELKEAVVWSPALASAARRATVLPQGHTLGSEPGPPVPVRPPGEFLLDPNPAVTRAGVVEELARTLDAWKIDEQIAFLSADSPMRSPFGRTLRIIESAPWNQKRLPERLRALDIGSVDIRRRGLAGDVEWLHRRLRLSGTRRATLVMTRVGNRPWGFVCLDAHHEHGLLDA